MKRASSRKKIRVSYTLRSKSHTSGKIIDSSHNFGFRVGKGEVIKGWDIGLEGEGILEDLEDSLYLLVLDTVIKM